MLGGTGVAVIAESHSLTASARILSTTDTGWDPAGSLLADRRGLHRERCVEIDPVPPGAERQDRSENGKGI